MDFNTTTEAPMAPQVLASADGVECVVYGSYKNSCFITRSLVDGLVFYRGRSPITAQKHFNDNVAPEFRITEV